MSQKINTFDENLAVHQQMDDEPNDVGGLSAEELKAKFDFAALALQKFINEQMVPAHNRLGVDLDQLAEILRNHVDVDPGNITAQNVGLLRELADKYGLTDKLAPTVHDALAVLEPLVEPRDQLVKLAPAHIYMEHWWRRRRPATYFAPMVSNPFTVSGRDGVTETNSIVYGDTGTDLQTVTIYYADEVCHTVDGNLVLVEPKSLVLSGGPSTLEETEFDRNQDLLRGKYVENNKGYFIYIPSDAAFQEYAGSSSTGKRWLCAASPVCKVSANVPARKWEDLHSENRGAYPDGVDGDWEYQYAGVPMDEVVQTWLRDKFPDEEDAE